MQPVDDRGRAVEKLLAGRYEVLGFLGRGGFASVYQVRSASLQRFEALKVLHERHVEGSEFARRFRQEARVAASLEHPSIVKIYDSGHVEGTLWYSMQFVQGPTLTGELARLGAFDEKTAARIVIPLLDALDYSHARGIIHRDIKPDNVILDKRGQPFLLDFGIAKTDDNLVKTQTGFILGSPAYLSPEQLRGLALDGRTDIYSLGVTLYQMLAGVVPYRTESIPALARRLTEDAPSLSGRRAGVHSELERIVHRSLTRDREVRYATAAEMREDLETFLAEVHPKTTRARPLFSERPAVEVPTVLGKYRIGNPVGRGATGTVYAAVDELLQRPAAVKVFALPDSPSAEALGRFLQEARAVARVEHRNVVRLYDADVEGDVPYIAMEFLPGGDTREFLRTPRPLSRSLDVLAQVFEGLASAHRAGVLHRDLKPANVLFTADGVPRLIDFSLARLLGTSPDLTGNRVLGNAAYKSPERISDPQTVDARSDLFSAGVILFEAVTGRLPFQGATVAETLERIIDEAALDPKTLAPDCPPDLAETILQCLEKDPSRRPASGDAVALALRLVQERLDALTGVTTASIALRLGPTHEPTPAGTRVAESASLDETTSLEDFDAQSAAAPGEPDRTGPAPAPAARRFPGGALAGGVFTGLLLVGGTIALLRWSSSSAPPVPATSVTPLGRSDADVRPSMVAGPVLTADAPPAGQHHVTVARGGSFLFKVVGHGAPAAAAPRWHRNDELVASGAEWLFLAGAPGRELVTVSYGDESAGRVTTLAWYVTVR